MTKRLKKAFKAQKRKTKQEVPQIYGLLGLRVSRRTVEVPNRNSYVYVRLRNNESEVIQAFNNKVAPAYNLPVIVERRRNKYVVVAVDEERYENNWNSFAPFLPRHGNTHSFNLENGGGGDVVWVYPQQFIPALIFPSGSVGANNLIMHPYTLKNADGTWKYVGNTGTPSLAPYNPTTGTQAVMVMVYLDSVSGNPNLMVGSGSYFPATVTGSSEIIPYIPSLSNPNHIPLAAVRLVTGTSVLSWNNIYDVRQFIHTTPTGTGGGGGGSIITGTTIWDEGVPLGTVGTLNFIGNNVDVSVSGSVARIHVTGSTGGGIANLTGTSIGQPNAVVMTSPTGTLVAQPWLQWSTAGSFASRPYIKFGADVAEQDGFAGVIGYRIFGSEYLDIVGAGTGTNARNVRIFDNLNVNFIATSQYLKNTSFNSAWPYSDSAGLYVLPTSAPSETTITGSFQVLGLNASNTSIRFPVQNLAEAVVYSEVIGTFLNAATVPASTAYSSCPFKDTANATGNTFPWPESGRLSHLTFRTPGGQPASGSLVITLQVNGVDTAVTVTVPAGQATALTVTDSTNTVNISSGDLLSWKLQNNATATSASCTAISMRISKRATA